MSKWNECPKKCKYFDIRLEKTCTLNPKNAYECILVHKALKLMSKKKIK